MSNAELRARARQQLGGGPFANSWLMCLAVIFVANAANTAISSICPPFSILIVGAIEVSLAFITVGVVRGGEIRFENLLFGFTDGRFVENLLLGLLSSLFIMLWSLLFLIPGIVKSYAYSMAYYLRVDHPEYNWRKALDESQKLMNGKKMQLFLLDLSFIGWYILGALLCGIGTLFVVPYHQVARANFYESLTYVTPFEAV